MSNRVCAVPFCKSTGNCISTRTNKKISYHKFPSDSKMKQQWLINIRRDENKYFQVKNHTVVCSEHFKEEDIELYPFSKRSRLNIGSVPTIFKCWGNLPELKINTDHKKQPKKSETRKSVLESGNQLHPGGGKLSGNRDERHSVQPQLAPEIAESTLNSLCQSCVSNEEKISKLERKCAKLLENCHALKQENVKLKQEMETKLKLCVNSDSK